MKCNYKPPKPLKPSEYKDMCDALRSYWIEKAIKRENDNEKAARTVINLMDELGLMRKK